MNIIEYIKNISRNRRYIHIDNNQVKAKILDAVYKNTPFSLRPTIDEVNKRSVFCKYLKL